MIKTALFAAAAAITTIATAAPALAKDVPVFYGDLDLASAKDQTTLSHRIHRAAQKACNFNNEGRVRSQAAIACYKQAKTGADTQVAAVAQETRLGG